MFFSKRLLLTLVCVGVAATVTSVDARAAVPFHQDDGALDAAVEAAVTRDLAWLAELGDRCPAYIVRRLANQEDARIAAALAAAHGDASRAWHARALALTAWARHVRLFHEGDIEARDACLAAIEAWLGEGAGPMQRSAALVAADELGPDGEFILRRTVETAPDTTDRFLAMRLFAQRSGLPDYAWFKEIYERGGKKAPAEEQRAYGAGGELAHLRFLAFRRIASEMRAQEMETALEDRSLDIRVEAVRIQEQRGDDKSYDRALAYLDNEREPMALRLWAASALSRVFDRERHYTMLFEYGASPKCDPELRNHIAERIQQAMPQRVLDLVRKQIGRGKLAQKLYAIDALPQTVMVGLREREPREGEDDEVRAFDDEKVLGELRTGVTDKDPLLRMASIEALVERRDFEALAALERAARRAKTDHDRAALLLARIALGAPEKDTRADAVAMLQAESPIERRAALRALVALDPDAFEEQLRASLSEGPSHEARALIAAIVERRWPRGVALLVEALDRPERVVREAARSALWQLTARDEGPRAADWSAWWDGARGSFVPAGEDAVATFREELGEPVRREHDFAEFFGLALQHTQVAVAFDCGPELMGAPLLRRAFAGAEAKTLLDVLRQEVLELTRICGPELSLRLYSTRDGNDGPWVGSAGVDAERRAEVESWLSTYAPMRTADIPALVAAALADPSIEALVIVSSGDQGKVDVEAFESVRRTFQLENRERGLVVHGVSLGGSSRLLRWLAETSGGSHTHAQ